MVRIHYFFVMVTVMQFSQFFFYESQLKELRKAFKKEKKNFKLLLTFLLLFYYFFYDLKYINSPKKRFSNKKSGIVPKVTMILNLLMNIVTKFQVFIFKNDKVRGGEETSPPPNMK